MPDRLRGGTWAVAVVGVLLFAWAPSLAEESPTSAPEAQPTVSAVDRRHAEVSLEVERLSQRIDGLLGDRRAYEESTGSYLKVGGSAALLEKGQIRFDHVLRAKIVLPRTQERLKLLLESDEDPDFGAGLAGRDGHAGEDPALREQASTAGSYLAGLELFVAEKLKWNVASAAGVRLRWPPDPFVRVRGTRTVPLGDWSLRAAQTLFWYDSRGAGEETSLSFERGLGERTLFRSTSEAVWTERRGLFELGQSLSVFQEVTPRDLLTYRVRVGGENEPTLHAERYGASVSYRRRLYDRWLFLRVEPELLFEKGSGFRGEPSIRFSLEAMFGADYA